MTREEAYKKLDEVFQNVGEMMDIILERTK